MVFYRNLWIIIKCVDACKPDSVLSILMMIIRLDLELPLNSSGLPEPFKGINSGSYLTLLLVGLA